MDFFKKSCFIMARAFRRDFSYAVFIPSLFGMVLSGVNQINRPSEKDGLGPVPSSSKVFDSMRK